MLRIEVRRNSLQQVSSYLEETKGRILIAAMSGMGEAMVGLAGHVVETHLSGSPVGMRTGALAGNVLSSPFVRLVKNKIIGRVSTKAKGSKDKPYAIWLEHGAKNPAVTGRLMVFEGRDGKTVFTWKRRAFLLKPRPFMRPSIREYQNTIFETLNARVKEAIASGN